VFSALVGEKVPPRAWVRVRVRDRVTSTIMGIPMANTCLPVSLASSREEQAEATPGPLSAQWLGGQTQTGHHDMGGARLECTSKHWINRCRSISHRNDAHGASGENPGISSTVKGISCGGSVVRRPFGIAGGAEVFGASGVTASGTGIEGWGKRGGVRRMQRSESTDLVPSLPLAQLMLASSRSISSESAVQRPRGCVSRAEVFGASGWLRFWPTGFLLFTLACGSVVRKPGQLRAGLKYLEYRSVRFC
jgi:hypothetical protein